MFYWLFIWHLDFDLHVQDRCYHFRNILCRAARVADEPFKRIFAKFHFVNTDTYIHTRRVAYFEFIREKMRYYLDKVSRVNQFQHKPASKDALS